MSTKMDENDWAHTLAVFRACLPRRGRRAEDDRRFLEALHFFTVENVRWRALPERFGHWNSVWKRFDRLSKAGVFEAFLKMLASLESPRRISFRCSTRPPCALMSRRPEQRGARRPGARALAWRLHHENPRKIGRLRRHHRLRPDRRRSPRRASLRNPARYGPTFSRAPSSATKATPARPTATPRERAASLRSSRTRRTKRTSRPSSHERSTKPAPASSRASDGSSASSGSRYAAKRPPKTSDRSSASPPAYA